MRKPVPKKAALRYLRDVADGESAFHARDGSRLRNLIDLYFFLRNCDKRTFRLHVDGSKNDFADWVRDTLLDEELAEVMARCISNKPMAYRVLHRVNSLVPAAMQKLRGAEGASTLLEEAVVPEELFLSADGRTLGSLWELYDFLEDMDEEVFAHHVSEGKNDLADWVDEVICDTKLANGLRNARSKELMSALVGLRVSILENNKIPEENKEFCSRATKSIM